MALSPQDAELLARIMGGPLSQLQGMTAPPEITPEMAFGAPTMPGGFAPAGDSRSIPQAAFGPMPEAMRAVPSPQAPRGGAFVPLVPGQGAAPQPYGGPDTPLARANFGGPPAPAPAPAPAMAAYGPMGGAAPGSAAFSPLPQAADRLSAIPPEQMPGGGMLGKVPMPEELAGYTVGLGPEGPVVSGGPVQSAVATNDAPMAPQQAQGGLGGLGGFFGGLFDPSTPRGEDFQNMMLGWAAGAGGTWQDSLAGGAKMVAAGRLSRKEKDELAKSKNKTLEWAVSNGVDPATAQAYVDAGEAKSLISLVEKQKEAASQTVKPDFVVIGDKLVDRNNPDNVRDFGDATAEVPVGYEMVSPEQAKAMGLDPSRPYQKNTKTGKIEPIGSSGQTIQVGSKLTESQSKDVSFLNRGKAAFANLQGQFDVLANATDSYGGRLPIVGNYVKSDEFRRAEQAAREVLAVILRKDTGAAITDQEMEIYGKTFLPQPGDDKATIAQKLASAKNAIDAMYTGLGTLGPEFVPGYTVGLPQTAPAAADNDPLGLRN